MQNQKTLRKHLKKQSFDPSIVVKPQVHCTWGFYWQQSHVSNVLCPIHKKKKNQVQTHCIELKIDNGFKPIVV